jgi:hypothetical protein
MATMFTRQDVLNLGLEVPTMYLVPKKRFDRLRGINFCEVEFPTVCATLGIPSERPYSERSPPFVQIIALNCIF